MGVLSRLYERRYSLSDLDQSMDRAVMGYQSSSGVDVNPDSALSVMAVYQAVRLLSETIGSLPLHLYRRLDPQGKERATDHSLYSILRDAPNPEQTAMEWREMMQGHLCLRGNAYSEIIRNNGGEVVGLWPLHPDRVRIRREAGALIYYVRVPGQSTEIKMPWFDVLHLRGLSSNGVTGLSPIAIAREALGLGIAAQEYGARLFKNDARPGGVLEHPNKLSPIAHKRLKESWDQNHGGLSNAHRMAILEEGMKWHQIGISPDDAQFLETRKFQVTEIARMFNVPPHFLADLERATFSNIEQQAIEFVVYSIRPWLVRWEQRINLSLLFESERATLFPEFLVNALLRGDSKTRFEAYHLARLDGWMNADEIRDMENMNPLPNGAGQEFWKPVNIGFADDQPADNQPTAIRDAVKLALADMRGQDKPSAPVQFTVHNKNGRRRYTFLRDPQTNVITGAESEEVAT